jgi:DNA-binding transcriptional MerR regulator
VDDLDLGQLCRSCRVTPRTVHFYVQQGLLPPAASRGPGARYTTEHLDRLRLIRRLQREHLPLAEIRKRLGRLDPGEIKTLAAEPASKQAPASPLEYIRAVLDRSGPPDRRLPALGLAPGRPPSAPGPELLGPQVWQASGSSRDPVAPARSQWERIRLASDVELHLRRPLSREMNRRIERLITLCRTLLEEEAP